jgi:excisionase family DNA binding protein
MGDLKLYPVEELAGLLSIKEATVRKILREGRLSGRKLAKKWYVSEDSLKAYFQKPETQKTSD